MKKSLSIGILALCSAFVLTSTRAEANRGARVAQVRASVAQRATNVRTWAGRQVQRAENWAKAHPKTTLAIGVGIGVAAATTGTWVPVAVTAAKFVAAKAVAAGTAVVAAAAANPGTAAALTTATVATGFAVKASVENRDIRNALNARGIEVPKGPGLMGRLKAMFRRGNANAAAPAVVK